MNERIKAIRKSLDLTQTEFGERFGVSRDVIANIENGRVAPTELQIRTISRIFNVDYGWLRDGLGSMFANQQNADLAAIDVLLTGENETAKTLFKAFANLSAEEWGVLRKLIDYIKGSP